MPDLKKGAKGLEKLLKGDGTGKDSKVRLVVLLGIAGMALILFSQLAQVAQEKQPEPEEESSSLETAEEYVARIEERLGVIISEIDGVGRAQVMVTLENAGEYVYAQEEKRNVDRTTESGAEGEDQKTTQKENVEQTYLLVETDYGRKQPLVKTQLQPKIQGVVIVCEGAEDVRVQQSLINVVTTALGIPSTRVCVVKIS